MLAILYFVLSYYSAPQCSHCKRYTSYGNSVCLSVCLAVCLSVCLYVRPSVTRRYCVKTVASSTVKFLLSNIKICLVMSKEKIFPSDDHFPLKSWLKMTYPLVIAASLDTFCFVAPQREELAKTVQSWRTGSRTRAFQRAINQGYRLPL